MEKQCEYYECTTIDDEENMTNIGHITNPMWVCNVCIDRVDNPTGYCSLDCQLGYGCDHSC